MKQTRCTDVTVEYCGISIDASVTTDGEVDIERVYLSRGWNEIELPDILEQFLYDGKAYKGSQSTHMDEIRRLAVEEAGNVD